MLCHGLPQIWALSSSPYEAQHSSRSTYNVSFTVHTLRHLCEEREMRIYVRITTPPKPGPQDDKQDQTPSNEPEHQLDRAAYRAEHQSY
ncbi:hypothetical protein Malapachy_1501 [Malassezia pachydermatis]|uniref:Uncharacterized protein n=1 Tax=Malassezia pachydermatis TaxID=77020 RepID=A0A0N0RS23_9BASI|nr:hypothetical protein Malapachy_1501 [Malassezia pachydermatis]KOS13203.1 hypothetical protein Malapachy_1501 [Malassezia pachydermatis]